MMRDEWRALPDGVRIHASAVVAPWVRLGAGCIVHPYAVVGRVPDRSRALARQPVSCEDLVVGERVSIGCHAVVFADVSIGDDSLIGDHAIVREGTTIGKRCVIGFHVSISYDCEVSDDCRFQNGTVFHGSCGEGCFFGVGVVCSSDRNIDLTDYAHRGSTPPLFGKRVMVGSGANIVAGAKIGDDALIAAGAVVVSDVASRAVMMGPKARERAAIAHHPV